VSPRTARFATVLFDADSTLASIEGIDWLAERRGPALASEIARLTERAMSGDVPLEDVYAARIARIRPTRAEIDLLARAYVERIVPGSVELVAALHEARVHVHIVSGGLSDALRPLAARLSIAPECVHAVSLASSSDGDILDALDGDQPLTRQGGKPVVVRRLLDAGIVAKPIAFVGDGSTDAATRPVVDAFIAFTGITRRPAVLTAAHAEASTMQQLTDLLLTT